MKKISLIFVLLLSLSLNSCENNIKLDSIVNTTWRLSVDDENYLEYSFFANDVGEMVICDMGEKTTTKTEYKISSSGFLKVRFVIAEGYEGDWKYGNFDAEKGTLELDGSYYKLVKY